MKRFSYFMCLIMAYVCISCYSNLNELDTNSLNFKEAFENTLSLNDIDKISTKVDYELLLKYLKLTDKDESVSNITPLMIETDTLAYYVKYNNGWEIISGDKRLSPVLIKSDSGEANINDSDIQALLKYIANLDFDNNVKFYKIWEWLDNRNYNNQISTFNSKRGIAMGMWRPLDTLLSLDITSVPHIISSRWFQSTPWNGFVPFVNVNNNIRQGVVGCAAVASGQIIHHFRKNNSLNLKFPISAQAALNNVRYIFDSGDGEPRWATMANSVNDYDTESVALMLSYLGFEIMNLNYIDTITTSFLKENIHDAFNWGKLNYTCTNGYNYDIIYNNLINNVPICICSDITSSTVSNHNNVSTKHVYIIDRYEEYRYYLSVRYVWDPDYSPTEQEYNSSEAWMFENNDGSSEKVFEIDQMTDSYFGMLWGYSNMSLNNKLYLAKSQLFPFEDEAGYTPGYEHIYPPHWETQCDTTGNVLYMFHNFSSL